MQPMYKPQPMQETQVQRQTAPEPEPKPASRRELEEALAGSLARVVHGEASFIVVDGTAGKAYRVTVEDHPFPSDDIGVLYMKAGPAGETCKCCSGSGVED